MARVRDEDAVVDRAAEVIPRRAFGRHVVCLGEERLARRYGLFQLQAEGSGRRTGGCRSMEPTASAGAQGIQQDLLGLASPRRLNSVNASSTGTRE